MDGTNTPLNRLTAGGAVRRWLLLGPFRNAILDVSLPDGTARAGLDTDYLLPIGGETNAELSPLTAITCLGPNGAGLTARTVTAIAQPNDNVDFSVAYPGRQFHVAYGFSLLESDSDHTVYAYFGSKDGAKIWVNGEQVLRVWTGRRAVRPWTDRFLVRLHRGINPVLVKVENAGDEWAFVFHLYTEADHLQAARARVRSLSLTADGHVVPTGGPLPSVRVQTLPRTLLPPLAVRLEVRDREGHCRKEIVSHTERQVIPGLPGLDPGFVTLKAFSTDPRLPNIAGQAKLFVGELRAARSRLLTRVERLRRCRTGTRSGTARAHWDRLHQGILDFARWWLRSESMDVTEADLRLLQDFESMAQDLEDDRDYLAGRLGRLYPIKYRDSTVGSSEPLQYLAYLPKGYGDPGRTWPLLVFLSGAGAVGHDIHRLKQHDLIRRLVDDRDYPLVVVAPQCPDGRDWNAREPAHLDAIVDDACTRMAIDAGRILVTGISMGGRAVWEWAAARPHRFAGVIPVCGRLDPTLAPRIRHLPMSIWHGDCDGTVPVYYADLAVAKLREAGSAVQYRVIEGEGHDAWDHAYRDPDLVRWMLGLRRQSGWGPALPPEAAATGDSLPDAGRHGQVLYDRHRNEISPYREPAADPKASPRPAAGYLPTPRCEERTGPEELEPIGMRHEPRMPWCYLPAQCGIEGLHRTLYLKLIELFGHLRFRHGLTAERFPEVVFQGPANPPSRSIRFLIGVPTHDPPQKDDVLSRGHLEGLRCGTALYRGSVSGLDGAFASLARWMRARGSLPAGDRRMRVRYVNRDLDYLDAELLVGEADASANPV